MHVYDIAGDLRELAEIVRALEGIANSAFAAVLNATTYREDPVAEALLALGFSVDWDEADTRDGHPSHVAGFVRAVS